MDIFENLVPRNHIDETFRRSKLKQPKYQTKGEGRKQNNTKVLKEIKFENKKEQKTSRETITIQL